MRNDALAKRNSRLIYLSTSLAGQSGPHAKLAGFGNLGAASGLSLRMLDADGSVFLASRSGGAGQTESSPTEQKLSAERVTYDATTGVATATGTDAWPANFLESQRATPVYATKIIWNLLTGRFEAEGIRTISGPR